jgi:hypothetical protein
MKSKTDANLATSTSTAKSESNLFSVIHSDHVSDTTSDSVITVNVASANCSADFWLLDTGATNHIPCNRHLFQAVHSLANRMHQGKTSNNSFVDAERSATNT